MSSSLLWGVNLDAVHQTISHHQNAITSLDGEIEGFMRIIRQLQFEKQKHLVEIKHCKGLITLAKRLPPEILASIFEECVRDGWTRTPLVVSHVCSSWRKAATIPTVWAHIYVNLDARNPCQRTRLWLDKSQDALLTIDIEVNNDISNLGDTMQVLTSDIRRWRALSIKSAMLRPVNQILQVCDGPAPHLHAVDISVAQEFSPPATNNGNEEERELVALRSSFVDAPRFKYLRLRRNLLPSRNILPSSITNLSFQLPCYQFSTTQSVSAIIHLLRDLPNLVSFSIEVPNGGRQRFLLDVDPSECADLPHLKSMVLMGSNDIMGILPHIRVPTLTHLHLRSSLEYDQTVDIGLWIDLFIQGSCPPISLLEIRDLVLDPVTYGRILRVLPSLQELRLHDSDVIDLTLYELNGSHGFCPALRRLDLRWCGRLSGRALVDLVRSRVPGDVDDGDIASSSIEEVTLINCSFVKEEDILDLAGMTVCRLIHHDQDDFCNAYGCCDNERYRRRLKQRSSLNTFIGQAYSKARLIL